MAKPTFFAVTSSFLDGLLLRTEAFFCIVFFVFFSALPATPSPATVRDRPITVVNVDYPQIRLRVKLLASSSLVIASDSFELRENNQIVPLNIIKKRTPRQSIVLLLDRSSSIAPSVREIKQSAYRFVMALPAKAKIGIISFASDVEINQGFTHNRKKLIHAIRMIRPWGGTALYDAIFLACEQLYSDSEPSDLRTLVLFTDGKDETPALRTRMSIKSMKEVLEMATRNNIRIIAVGMGTDIDKEKMEKMAHDTNGWYQHAPTAKELFGIYRNIARRLQQEQHFRLGYLSQASREPGTKVKVSLKYSSGTRQQDFTTTYEVPIREIRPTIRPPRAIRPTRHFTKPAPKKFVPAVLDSSINGKYAPSAPPKPVSPGLDLPDVPSSL